MTSEICRKVVLQLLQYVLSLPCNSKPNTEKSRTEVEVQFEHCNNKLSKIEVTYRSKHLPPFDVRSFCKVIPKDLVAIIDHSNLESQDSYAGLTVLHCIDGTSILYTLRSANNINKDSLPKLDRNILQKSLVVDSIQELNSFEFNAHTGTNSISENESSILISLNMGVSQNVILDLENSTINFMKKCQLVNPYLTVICSNIHNIKRFGVKGNWLSKDSLLENIDSYLRNVDTASDINSVKLLVQHIKQNSFVNDLCFSLVYTCASHSKIGRQNHCHVFLFSNQGLPINIEISNWHTCVKLTDIESDISLEPTRDLIDCGEMIDICYKIKNTTVSSCFLVFIFVQNLYTLEVILKEHGKSLAVALTQILKKMLCNLEEREHEKKLNHMVATSMGSVIRFTDNSELRCECLDLLQASDTMDAEIVIDSRLQKYFLPS